MENLQPSWVTCSCHPHDFQRESPVLLSVILASYLIVATIVEPGSILSAPSIQVFLYINEVCLVLLLLRGELSQLSQSFLIGSSPITLVFVPLLVSLSSMSRLLLSCSAQTFAFANEKNLHDICGV